MQTIILSWIARKVIITQPGQPKYKAVGHLIVLIAKLVPS